VTRARVGVGIVAVAAGMAWALGGIPSLVTSARTVAELLPLLLVIGGVGTILLVALPRGALAGPVLLVAIGGLGLALEFGLFRRSLFTHVPALILIGLGVVIAMSRHEKQQVDTGVQRCTAILLPAHPPLNGTAPRKFVARAIFGFLVLDLTHASYPGTDRLWIDITCVLGRVEIRLPKDWKVQAGRIELARRMAFEGRLTSAEIAPPGRHDDEVGTNLVVLNVQGWAGAVRVTQD
jgi:hypothetical protein